MFVLFEESGAFKAGTVLTAADASMQVETMHGKRIKLKSSHVLLEFRQPEPARLLAEAETGAAELDPAFLWEVCGDDEFDFGEFATDYFGHEPSAVEAATVLLGLHAAPLYFHRKGRGRFRKAPPDILQAALAGAEKKRLQQEAMEAIRDELIAGRFPPALDGMVDTLLYRPDRSRIETRALEEACVERGLSAARLLLECGAIESSHAFHYRRFLFEHFPRGTGFPPYPPPATRDELPLAEVRAFSIDDASTTEIDDAFSITPKEGGGWLIGIHIAAPGLGFSRGSELDQVARTRLSTVYMPGNKITMLPDEVVDQFTLTTGEARPALSLYLDVSPALAITAHRSCIERVPVLANLRHHDIEPFFNQQALEQDGDGPDYPWKQELILLWHLANVLEAGRGKTGTAPQQTDFNFSVDWDVMTADGSGAITIGQRERGSPLDKLVSELMILTNSTWGKELAECNIAGLYRVQNGGKVRMSMHAEPHDALGVDCYAWSSSPLRRYIDLVNQWQIIAMLTEGEPPFAPRSVDLAAALRDFELTYAAYAEFQRGMERYWCLRWLRQHGRGEVEATVLRENVVRLAEIPLVIRVPSMPLQMPGSRVKLFVERTDLLDVEVEARFVQTLAEPDPATVDETGFGFA